MRIEEIMALEKRVDEENDWRHRPANAYTRDDLALVSKVSTEGRALKAAIKESVDLIGGFRKAINPGDRVMIKPNFNSGDPFPAATDIPFLVAVVELLREEGITDVTVGERSGWKALPTAPVMEQLGVYPAARETGFKVLNFEDGPWMDVRLGEGTRWWDGKITLSGWLKNFDKIIYLPCMKTHYAAGFTMSLKLSVGATHPAIIPYLHADRVSEKIDEPMYLKMLEIATLVGPDLIIMDGRKSFVTGGPHTGELVEPRVILASGDRIAIDVEGVKVLQQYPRDNLIQISAWEMPLIQRAIELGLGVGSEAEYRMVATG